MSQNKTFKKPYNTPVLIEHGDVEKITLGAGCPNRDDNSGPDDDAYPNQGRDCQGNPLSS